MSSTSIVVTVPQSTFHAVPQPMCYKQMGLLPRIPLESRKRKSDSAEGGKVKERRELVQLGGIIDLT